MHLRFKGPGTLKVGSEIYSPGEDFENNDRDWSGPIRLGLVELVEDADGETEAVADAEEPSETAAGEETGKPRAEIVEGKAGWLYVEVDGERVGSPTRDRDAAETLLIQYLQPASSAHHSKQ